MEKMSNLLKYIAPAFLLGMFTLIVSCEDDDEVVIDDTNLIFMQGEINGVELKGSANEVLTDVNISLLFSHEMVTTAVTDALSISGGNGAADFNLEFGNTNSALLLSSVDGLDYETTYTIALPAGAYGAKGETLNDDFSVSFTTQAFIPPQVSLSVNTIEIEENGGSAILTAALDKPADSDVTVVLESVGSATLDTDFTLDPLTLTIPVGSLEATAAITAKPDSEGEVNEEIAIAIASVTNADAGEPSTVSVMIQEQAAPLELKGVMAIRWATETSGNDGKAVHLYANEDIADLSTYGIGVANNGGGTDGQEYTFPAISVNAGDHILVARNPTVLGDYFGTCFAEFDHVFLDETGSIAQNGDDAIELFSNGDVIETYGDANVDGTGMDWEYSSSWAYKYDGSWITGGVDCSAGSTSMADTSCVYPLCAPAVELKGVLALVWDGSGTNGGKAWHLRVNKDVDDLSIYGIGVANNGGGTDGQEFTLPAVSAKEGDNILIAREPGTITAYFGNCINKFDFVIDSQDAANQNGDDAIELFENGVVIETYGDANVDGTGEGWEYSGTWAYKMDGIWTVGGLDCAATATSNATSACPYPECN